MPKTNASVFLLCKELIIFFAALTIFSTPALAAPERITLTAEDGFRITGIMNRANGQSGVVLLHMYRHDKESWQPLIAQLTERGISSLAIDMRGHGESRIAPDGHDAAEQVLDRASSLFHRMHLDAEAAVRYLASHGIDRQRIALAGASVGCSVALHTVAAGKVPVAAVVVMTPGKDYLGVPTMTHIKNWPNIPLLILSSRQEEERGAIAIYETLKDKGAQLKIFEQEDIHGTNMFEEVYGVETLIGQWLADSM